MTDLTILDNPIWNSLTTTHQPMSRGAKLARRYASDVSHLSGLQNATVEAFADLRALVNKGEGAGLFTPEPVEPPETWSVVRTRVMDQMVCTEPVQISLPPLLNLGPQDVPEMLALTAAAEPGPFFSETIAMGRYFGMRSASGRLMAMAGERLKPGPFTELSAVCTDPEFRGQGHARALVTTLAFRILSEGRIPFLHVTIENDAKVLYRKVGFQYRRRIYLTVIMPSDGVASDAAT